MLTEQSFLLSNKGFSDLNPLVAGHQQCKPSAGLVPHARSYCLIHYIISGKGIFYDEDAEYDVKAGEAFVIKPGRITTYIADKDDPWHYIWIGFNGNLSKSFESLPAVITPEPSIFYNILECEHIGNQREEFLAGQLFLLHASLFESKHSGNYVEIAKNYIMTNYFKKIRIDEIAAMLKIDKRYFSRIFKIQTGYTPQAFLVQTRMTKAARLLSEGTTVGKCAQMVGYDDAFCFSKAFKKYYGVSPSHYNSSE